MPWSLTSWGSSEAGALSRLSHEALQFGIWSGSLEHMICKRKSFRAVPQFVVLQAQIGVVKRPSEPA